MIEQLSRLHSIFILEKWVFLWGYLVDAISFLMYYRSLILSIRSLTQDDN